jgi:hypothetical protein
MRLGIAEIFAGDHKIRRRYGYGSNSGFFERGGKEARAQAFSKRSEAIEQFGAGSDVALGRYFVKKIAAEQFEFTANPEMVVFFELQIMQHLEVERQENFDFAAGVSKFSVGQSVRDQKKMIGDTLHGGDDHGDERDSRGAAHETRCVEHALRTEQRAAAEFEGQDVQLRRGHPAGRNAAFL